MKNYITKLCVMLLLFTSCKSKMSKAPEKVFGKESYYTELLSGAQSNVPDKQVRIIKDNASLQNAYREINSTISPGYELPKVDWKKFTIIAAYGGTKSTGGYTVEVYQVESTDDATDFVFTVNAPDDYSMATQVMTTPFLLIKVPNEDEKITASF